MNKDKIINTLNEAIKQDTDFLASNGPCESMIVITDGDYLVSTGTVTGPFVKMERDNKGKMTLPAGKVNAVNVYEGTTLTKKNAQIIANHINNHATNRKGQPCIVVKMRRAVQTRLEKNTNLLAALNNN